MAVVSFPIGGGGMECGLGALGVLVFVCWVV